MHSQLDDELQDSQLLLAILTSLQEFDKAEIFSRAPRRHSTDVRELCLFSLYYRVFANVTSLLTLGHARDFQVLAMLARGIFELAVELRLLTECTDAADKMVALSDYERLKAAQKAVAYTDKVGLGPAEMQMYKRWIAENSAAIMQACKMYWPAHKAPPSHWSTLNLRDRAARLKDPFDRIYELSYSRLSWFVHGGVNGMVSFDTTDFVASCTLALQIAAESYRAVLETVIQEMRLSTMDPKILNRLRLAELLPMTESDSEASDLIEQFLG